MEKLIKRYNMECDIIPRKGNKIWKTGIITLLIIFILGYIYTKKYILFDILLVTATILLYIFV